jgi:hypothetical protein
VPGGASTPPNADGERELNVRANTGGDHSAKSKSALAGMVVHAFVDGVALGAAVREGDSALGLIVFLAIMLHKAPSSFGLSSYLLHHGISHDGGERGAPGAPEQGSQGRGGARHVCPTRSLRLCRPGPSLNAILLHPISCPPRPFFPPLLAVKRRLLLFSSAAPLGAMLTYSLLSINIFTYKQEMLALCLLFSGGTFLYVATAHVLPEIQAGGFEDEDEDEDHAAAEDGRHGHAHSHGHSHRTPPRMKWTEVWVMVAGVLLPLLLDVHHGH